MSTSAPTIADFTLTSRWTGYNEQNDPTSKWYSTPTTGYADYSYSLSGIPSGAIIDSAIVTSTLGSPSTGIDDCLINYDSVDYNFSSGSLDITAKVQASLASGSVSFRYKFKANGGTGTTSYTGISHSSGLGFSNNVITITYHMPVSTFTLSTTSLDAGQSITVNITRADSSYTHTVTFTFGSATQQYTGVATSQAFTIPLTGASSWLYQMPNSTSGTASCVVKTYSGATLMGTAPTKTFTVKVPTSIKPSATSLTSVIVNPYWSLYVQGKSKATLTVNGAAGAYGSTITGYSITSPGISGATNPYTTGYLTTAGTVTFSATVTDSRGRVSDAKTCSITVTAYAAPKITSMKVERASDAAGTLADEGTYCKCTISYTYSAIGSNTRTTKFAYKETTASTYGSDNTTLVSSGGNIVLGSGTTFDITKSYDIRITLDDAVESPKYGYIVLQTAEYIMDFKAGGGGVCFGGVATRNNALEISPNWEAYYKGEKLDTRFAALRVYSSSSQFGYTMTDTTTMQQLISAMPISCILIDSPASTNTGGLVPSQETTGTLRITKQGTGTGRLSVEFLAKSGRFFRYKIYSNDGVTWFDEGWKEVPIDGTTLSDRLTMPRLRLTSTTDASGTSANDVALCIGSQTAVHIEMDNNEIMAKSNGTTPTTLSLNNEGGDVLINGSHAWHSGDFKYLVGSVSLTVSTTGTVVNSTIDLSSAGFTAAPSVQCTIISSSPSLWNVSIGTPSTSSVVIYAERAPGTGSVTIKWLAMG